MSVINSEAGWYKCKKKVDPCCKYSLKLPSYGNPGNDILGCFRDYCGLICDFIFDLYSLTCVWSAVQRT